MPETLEYPDLLRLIDEQSAAFQAVIASAPSLDVPVPTCPGWTLVDLVQHLGKGRRRWAAIVAAGPADALPAEAAAEGSAEAPREREALTAWLAASVRTFQDALREADPDRGCWTWWERSVSPQTCGAVARHQLQEVAVHTYDARVALGAPQSLADEVALDGVDEFLETCCAGAYRWPYDPAVVEYRATDGRFWRVSLAADGVRVDRRPAPGTAAGVSVRGTAGDLVLALYGRIPVDSLELDGDRSLFDLLSAWDPDA